jgi:hypothetical protein
MQPIVAEMMLISSVVENLVFRWLDHRIVLRRGMSTSC